MGGDDERVEAPREDDPDGESGSPTGLVDSDDTTQADAGMTGGTGAAEGGATAQPYGTEPLEDTDEDDD